MTVDHLAPDLLEPDAYGSLTEAQRAHLDGCLRCRLRSDELRALDGLPPTPRGPRRAESAVRPAPEASGRRVGPYLLGEELGRGGMGVVHRAVHGATGASVALKTVRALRPGLLAGVRREIGALRSLSHPGVVRIVDDGVHEGAPWYAMTLVEGRPLSRMLGLRRMWHSRPLPQALSGEEAPRAVLLSVLHRLCDALACLHGHGVVHRDLNPGNVVVCSDGQPVLVDFGLAVPTYGADARERLEVAAAAGSALTISPEAVAGEPVDARADLYALGVLLYLALAGRPPLWADRPEALLARHLDRVPEPPSRHAPDVPDALCALAMALLEKRPADRPGYAVDVAERLAPFVPDARPLVAARPYVYRPALVGRDEALGVLERRFEALGEETGLMLVQGESGVGKTRLASAFGRWAAQRGALVITGACAAGAPRPLGGLHGLLHRIADRCAAEGDSGLLGRWGPLLWPYVPLLAELPGQRGLPEPEPLPLEAARHRLLTALLDIARRFSGERTLVLLVDDLQWADPLTTDWLGFVAAHPQPPPWLLLGTCRIEEDTGALAALRARPSTRTLTLPRLPAGELGRLVGGMLALREPPGPLVEVVARHSEGNPLFAAEYLRAAAEEGLLRRDGEGRWALAAAVPEALPLPATLSELLGRRLARLPADALRLAEVGAVLGRAFPSPLLSAVSGSDEAEPGVRALLARHLWEEGTDDGAPLLRFTHDRIREVAYSALSEPRRRELHERAALAMEALPGPERGPLLGQIGAHWQRAGRVEEARRAYLAAARSAVRASDLRGAEALFRAYFELDPPPSAERAEAGLVFARDVQLQLDGAVQAEGALRRLLDAGSGEEDPRTWEGRVSKVLGICCAEQGRCDEAQALYERALALHRAAGERGDEGSILVNLGSLHAGQGRHDEALACLTEALACHREAHDRRSEGITLNNLGLRYANRGQYDEALAHYVEALAIDREVGNRLGEGNVVGNLGLLHAEQGRNDEALTCYTEALAIHREVGDRWGESIALDRLGTLHAEQGRHDEALACYTEALGACRAIGSRMIEGIVLSDLAWLQGERGDRAGAIAGLDAAIEILRATGGAELSKALERLGALHLASGDPEAARRCLDEARSLLGEGAVDPSGYAAAPEAGEPWT